MYTLSATYAIKNEAPPADITAVMSAGGASFFIAYVAERVYIEHPDDNSLIWGNASVCGGFALASDNLDKTAIKKIAEKFSTK